MGTGVPRAIIPGGACSSLTVIQEAEVFPREPLSSPIIKSARIPGTPYLSVNLEGQSEMILERQISITMKLTYDGITNEDGEAWNFGYYLVDGPDVEVNVTDEDLFLSLHPGESWTEAFNFDLGDLHDDTAVGDSYRFRYWGGYVKWWIWGTREEHANTTVKVPPWRGAVVDPFGNEGKPDIIIPGSNTVEFVVVGS
ncbi:hypothetical protein F1880_007979 [Penicillium rolfsii]|nr:hypothetical protein F1880_007979 [Penicillium rolfsii]